ncbi:MAG: hypothetical protein Q9218_007814 [Villophora microphyllina]
MKHLNYPCNNISTAQCYHSEYVGNISITQHSVLYSIYNIWAWYNSLYTAIGDAVFQASLQASTILDVIKSDMPDPQPLPGRTPAQVLLSLLSAVLAFLKFPGEGLVTRTFSTAAQQAPGLTKAILATGSLGDKKTPLDQIDTLLGDILEQFRTNIANTLNSTQSDYNMFLSHAANGSFACKLPSINYTETGLTKLYKTFIVSRALQAHNVIVIVARGTSAYVFSGDNVRSEYRGHVNCQEPPDQYGIRDKWLINDSRNDTYALFKLDDMEHNFYGLMETIFGNQWTTGEDLFLGSEKCHSSDLDCPWRRLPNGSGTFETVAFNSIYDLLNTPLTALETQANQLDPTPCQQYPTDGSRPGWGGAGYLRRYHGRNNWCNRYLASYLGPGLYYNFDLCEEPLKKRSLTAKVWDKVQDAFRKVRRKVKCHMDTG